MKKIELIKVENVYCDFCGEIIKDFSYSSQLDKNGFRLDFHSWEKNCLEKYLKSIKPKNK